MNNQRRLFPYYIGVRVGEETSLALWSVEKKKLEKLITLPFLDSLVWIINVLEEKDAQVRYEHRNDVFSEKFTEFVQLKEIPHILIPYGYVGKVLSSESFYATTNKQGNINERTASAIVLDL